MQWKSVIWRWTHSSEHTSWTDVNSLQHLQAAHISVACGGYATESSPHSTEDQQLALLNEISCDQHKSPLLK